MVDLDHIPISNALNNAGVILWRGDNPVVIIAQGGAETLSVRFDRVMVMPPGALVPNVFQQNPIVNVDVTIGNVAYLQDPPGGGGGVALSYGMPGQQQTTILFT